MRTDSQQHLDYIKVLATTERELVVTRDRISKARLSPWTRAARLSWLEREEARLAKLVPLMQYTLRRALDLKEVSLPTEA